MMYQDDTRLRSRLWDDKDVDEIYCDVQRKDRHVHVGVDRRRAEVKELSRSTRPHDNEHGLQPT
jgi:hypothetical protein